MLSEHKKGNADADYIFAPLLYDPPWRACQHRQIIKICSTKTDRYSQAHKKSEKASPFFLRTPTTDVIPVRTVCWHVQFDSKQFYYPVLVAPEAISRIIGMSMNVCVCVRVSYFFPEQSSSAMLLLRSNGIALADKKSFLGRRSQDRWLDGRQTYIYVPPLPCPAQKQRSSITSSTHTHTCTHATGFFCTGGCAAAARAPFAQGHRVRARRRAERFNSKCESSSARARVGPLRYVRLLRAHMYDVWTVP